LIRAVIFDMDGVIVESESAHVEAEKQVLLKHGISISADELHEYAGTTAKAMFTDLIRKYKLKVEVESILLEKEQILFEFLEEDAEPTKGIMELLLRLKERNVKLCIGSSSPMKQIEYILKKLNIGCLFDYAVGSDNILHSKPDPEIFLKAAAGLGLKPQECLVVEDAKLGVEAAKRAGMRCIGYKNPSSGHQDLSKADIVINSFSQLNIEKALA
jgi:beta-phosphoglucomutase family hydrolase